MDSTEKLLQLQIQHAQRIWIETDKLIAYIYILFTYRYVVKIEKK